MNPVQAFILNTPSLGALIFTTVAVLSAFVVYAMARKLLRTHITQDAELLSAKIVARLGALHALILAMMFAQEMADSRIRIRNTTEDHVPVFFWLVLITGFLASIVPCYVYSPSAANLFVLGTYAAFNGFAMYVMFSISNPFSGALAIDSTRFQNLLLMMDSAR